MTAALKSRDPVRFQAYRLAASQVVRDRYRRHRDPTMALHGGVLLPARNENLREGFFPTTGARFC